MRVTRCHDSYFLLRRRRDTSVADDVRGDAEHLGDNRKHPAETEQCRPTQTPLPKSRLNVTSLTSGIFLGSPRS